MARPEKEANSPMRNARKRAGISVETLAERSGVTAIAIRGWELGYSAPMVTTAMAVADALGISIDEYVRGAGPMKERNEKT